MSADGCDRVWDFRVPRASASLSTENYENPPGFQFQAEGAEKEAEYVASLRQRQRQLQQQQGATATTAACGAAAATAPVSPQALALLQRKVWDSAIAPGKAFGMNLFMLYMGGGSGIFGVLILVYALHSCFRTLLSLPQHYQPFAATEGLRFVWLSKAIYVLICLSFAAYLFNQAASMGALPLNSGDYLGLIPQTVITSRAFPAQT
ncbi:hypothetical protein ACSSS7_003977 [Eimeria intestinalis]